MADPPRPPTPVSLIKSILPVHSPVRELRKQRLLASDSPLVPDEMSGRTKSNYEIWQATEEEMIREEEDPQGDSFRRDSWGYGYENRAGTGKWEGAPVLASSSTVDTSPAPISIIPTSSIFPIRPRTVAAGYEPERKVLTVVFRDGTFYNYYDVYPTTWHNFRLAHSKGQFIKRYLDGHRRGAAGPDASLVKGGHMEALYHVARTAQVIANGLQKGQKNDDRRRRAWNRSSYAVRDKRTGRVKTGANTKNRKAAWDNTKWRGMSASSRKNMQYGRPY